MEKKRNSKGKKNLPWLKAKVVESSIIDIQEKRRTNGLKWQHEIIKG
jgi:hypothetical protein